MPANVSTVPKFSSLFTSVGSTGSGWWTKSADKNVRYFNHSRHTLLRFERLDIAVPLPAPNELATFAASEKDVEKFV